MTSLVLEDLITTPIEQDILLEKSILVNAVRLHLYKNKNPSGSLKLSVIKNSVILATSINLISNLFVGITVTGFFHGYLLFIFNPVLVVNNSGTYTFKLEGINGYTYSSDNHIAWVKEHERRIAPMVDTLIDWTHSPLGMEFYANERI